MEMRYRNAKSAGLVEKWSVMRVLLVEDEGRMAENISEALHKQNILVDHAATLEIAREAVMGQLHVAILLDRKVPDGVGLTLIPLVRKERIGVPIIVLSALGASGDRIAGLDGGADDYLGKPFSLDELLARLRAVMRRNLELAPDTISLGASSFDTRSRHIAVSGMILPLPRRELLVFEALIRRAGRIVARESLEEAVFNYDDEIASNTLDAHISRLRKRLTNAKAGVEIHAVRGIGYMMKAAQ